MARLCGLDSISLRNAITIRLKKQLFLLTMLRYAIYPLIQGRIKVGHRLLLRTQTRYGGWSPACILIWFESMLFTFEKPNLPKDA